MLPALIVVTFLGIVAIASAGFILHGWRERIWKEETPLAEQGATEDWSPTEEFSRVEDDTGALDLNWFQTHIRMDDVEDRLKEALVTVTSKAIAHLKDDEKWPRITKLSTEQRVEAIPNRVRVATLMRNVSLRAGTAASSTEHPTIRSIRVGNNTVPVIPGRGNGDSATRSVRRIRPS